MGRIGSLRIVSYYDTETHASGGRWIIEKNGCCSQKGLPCEESTIKKEKCEEKKRDLGSESRVREKKIQRTTLKKLLRVTSCYLIFVLEHSPTC
jgi:hypothetical protein